ncbi:MAG: hypothetical protein EAZ67_04565 [Cytophagales bacterium]|nr:MAG: hypothetical protein EAZ67_04565 [Cytophagales bacterium]
MGSSQHAQKQASAIRLTSWASFVAALVFFFMQRYVTWQGLLRTHDSRYYEATAQNVGLYGLWQDHLGQIYTNWPPLYPFLLSFFPLHIPLWASWLQAFAGGLTVFVLMQLSHNANALGNIFQRFMLGAFCPLLMLCAVFMWSEAVFLCFSVCAFMFLKRYLAEARMFDAIALVLCLNLCCLSRHAGMLWVVGLTLILFSKSLDKYSKWWIPLFSSLSFLFWQLRNHFWINQVKDFKQAVGAVSLQESIFSYLATLGSWLSWAQLPEMWRMGLGLCFVIFLGCLFWKAKEEVWIRACGVLMLVYLLGLCGLRMNIPSESERYLLPIWLLLLPFWQSANSYLSERDSFFARFSDYGLWFVACLFALKGIKSWWFWAQA